MPLLAWADAKSPGIAVSSTFQQHMSLSSFPQPPAHIQGLDRLFPHLDKYTFVLRTEQIFTTPLGFRISRWCTILTGDEIAPRGTHPGGLDVVLARRQVP